MDLEHLKQNVLSTPLENSDLILLNTCSIREKAEQTIRKKLSSIDHLKKKNKNQKN